MTKGLKATLSLVLATLSFSAMGQQNEFVQGEVLVKFKGSSSVALNSASLANRAIGASTKSVVVPLSLNQVKIPNGMMVMDAVSYYQSLTTVQYAEPNYKGSYSVTPNDSKFNQQYAPQITKCPQAWDMTTGSTSVAVAILDSGFELTHEDMQGKFTAGFDFEDNDTDPSWDGEVNHGIHVAGIAGAATNNAKGIAGAGYNVKIMPLRLGSNPTVAASAAALIYAADHGAKVASMSYGRGIQTQTEQDAVNYAWSKGVVLFASSGNDGSQGQNYPAAYPKVIAVGATDDNDMRVGFSTYGNWVDIGAPGEGILSHVENNGYDTWDGTSMSCPMAAGIAGLVWSMALPGTTNAQIRQAIETTTDPIPNGGFVNGRINARKACEAIDPGSATISPVNAVFMWTGSSASGSATDLLATDAARYLVTSTLSNLGQVAGANVDLTFNAAAPIVREAIVSLEANGMSGTSGMLFLWNYSNNKYVQIKAFALRPSGVKRERIALPKDLTNYVSGGNLRIGLRAIGPKRAPKEWGKGVFDFHVGFLQLGTREVVP